MLVNELYNLIQTFDNFCSVNSHTTHISPVDMKKRLQLLIGMISNLKGLEDNYHFNDENEEILYYKTERPKLLHYAIYYERIVDAESKKPLGIGNSYYKQLKKQLQQDSITIMDELAYYRFENSHNDHSWFKKNSDKKDTFAIIKAYEMLEKYLNTKLDSRPTEEKIADSKVLVWTGTLADYAEELESLKETKTINNGDVTLADLDEAFRKIFIVKITNLSGTLNEVMDRIEPAKFSLKKVKAIQQKQKRLFANRK